MVKKGRPYTKGGKPATYLPKDNKKYHTLKILKEGPKTQTKLMEQQSLKTTQWRNYQNILNNMSEMEWIEQIDSTESNAHPYKITQTGISIEAAFANLLDDKKIAAELEKGFEMFTKRKQNQTSTD